MAQASSGSGVAAVEAYFHSDTNMEGATNTVSASGKDVDTDFAKQNSQTSDRMCRVLPQQPDLQC